MKAASFFSKEEQAQILASIREAELNTSGEIRVHIETECKEDVLDRAAWIFEKLGMKKTAERNGVLFYLAINDKKFAVLGDAGINSKVQPNFWDDVKELLQKNFQEGRFVQGLTEAISLAGIHLQAHFPYTRADVNELSDEISFNKQGEK
jgi:uncharacterized membrane protein